MTVIGDGKLRACFSRRVGIETNLILYSLLTTGTEVYRQIRLKVV